MDGCEDLVVCKGVDPGGRETCLPGPVFTAWTMKVAGLLGTSGNEEFMGLVFPPFISHYTIKSITVWKKNPREREAGVVSIVMVPPPWLP